MKKCPKCGSQYTDDTLRFCLQDGSRLGELPGKTDDGEVLTEFRRTEHADESEASRITRVAKRSTPVSGTSKVTVAVIGGIALIFVFGILAVAAWVIFKNLPTGNANNTNTPTPTPTATPKPTPTSTPPVTNINTANTGTFGTPTPFPTPAATPTVDLGHERVAIMQQVQQWKDATESGNLLSLMNNYASTVDYYNRRGASSATVRADKQRAYKLYSSMHIDITDFNAIVDSSGETATATFDKEWVFEGLERSTGKVKSQLKLKKFGARWYITGERDLKLYYKR